MSDLNAGAAVESDLGSALGSDLNSDVRLDEMTVRPKTPDRYIVLS